MDLTAWVVVEELCAVIVVTSSPGVAEPALPHAVRLAREHAGTPAGPRFDLFTIRLEPYGDDLHCTVERLDAQTTRSQVSASPEAYADDILRISTRTDVYTTDRGTLKIVREPADGGQRLQFTFNDETVNYKGFVPSGGSLPDPDALFDARPEMQAADAALYLRESVLHFEKGDYLSAFRDYYYHRHFAHFSDTAVAAALDGHGVSPELSADVGVALANGLRDKGQIENAEWVARSAGTLADEQGLTKLSRQAWRCGAACNEGLGDVDATEECYSRMLAGIPDPPVQRDDMAAFMSVGITGMVFLMSVDVEGMPDGPSPELIAQLDRSEQFLRTAHRGYLALKGEQTDWTRGAIELDLIRVRDLRGDHAGALQALDVLTKAGYWHDDERLGGTALQYRLAILAKLANDDDGARRTYLETLLREDQRHGFEPPAINAGRGAICLVHLGNALAASGRAMEAVNAYLRAIVRQLSAAQATVRPPSPGSRFGSLAAMDIMGRALRAIATAPSDEAADLIVLLLLLVDDAKGRHLRRDVGFQISEERVGSRMLREQMAGTRRLLVENKLDRRILVADYEHLIQGMSPGEEAHPGLIPPLTLMSKERMRALLDYLPNGARLVSLYAAPDQTHVHVLDRDTDRVSFYALRVPSSALERASAHMQAFFSGRGLYGSVDPRDPTRHDARLLAPLRTLEKILAPVAKRLEDAELLVISAHGAWHDLPLHGLLLPHMWARGVNPAITYVPSFGLMEQLVQRSERMGEVEPLALSTAPIQEDSSAALEAAHAVVLATLQNTGREVLDSFGPPREEILAPASVAGTQHLLAHGISHSGAGALGSGLLLGGSIDCSSDTFTAADVLTLDSCSAHVTVQACSLGSTVQSTGDELWGFTRALLASGANSVLAPLWNIDLASSTSLLNRFYMRWLIDGTPKWRAWADAQHEMACMSETSAWSHLYHWGAFQMTGI